MAFYADPLRSTMPFGMHGGRNAGMNRYGQQPDYTLEPWSDSSNSRPPNGLDLPPGMVVEVEQTTRQTYFGNNVISHPGSTIVHTNQYNPATNTYSPGRTFTLPQPPVNPFAPFAQPRLGYLQNLHSIPSPPNFYLQDTPRPRTTFYHGSQHSYPSGLDSTVAANTLQANLGAAQNLMQLLYQNSAFPPLLAPPPYPSIPRPSAPQRGNSPTAERLGTVARNPLTISSPAPNVRAPAFITQGALTAIYESYVSVQQAEAGLLSGQCEKGELQFTSATHAVVRIPGKVNETIVISGEEHCNRALNGDIVVVEILPTKGTPKHGKVVFIAEMSGTRQVIGKLTRKGRKNPVTDENYIKLALKPLDRVRFPMITVPFTAVPDDLKSTVLDQRGNKSVQYLAEITEWAAYQRSPVARIITCLNPDRLRTLGTANWSSTNAESDDEVEEDAPSMESTEGAESTDTVTLSEEEPRKDFRDECVFTIEQPDTKDREHAVSCKRLGDGVYRVGVHIPDEVPDNVEATETVSSLDPGTDSQTLSALFTVTDEGDMLDYQEVRGTIRSNAKVSCRQAQDIIDEANVQAPEGPVDSPDDQRTQQVKETVRDLHTITRTLRSQRIQKECLETEKTPSSLASDVVSSAPDEPKPWASGQLVEELALLTNKASRFK